MRIVFIGCVEFSSIALEKIIQLGANVVGVCTLVQSSFNADHVNLSSVSKLNNISWIDAQNINSGDNVRWIRECCPDIIFCFGWSRLLSRDILDIPPLGVIGYHPAALPENRGRHPLIWALVLGLEQTASTFFFMNDVADGGDILSQVIIPIGPKDDATLLYKRMTQIALRQIEDFLPMLANKSHTRIPQEISRSSSWRKRSKADGLIDWRMSAGNIYNLVRGLTLPYVGASFLHNGDEYKVWKVEQVCESPKNAEPGKIIANLCGKPVVKCGEGAVVLVEVSPNIDLQVGAYV